MSEYAEIETRSRVRRIKMGRLMRRIRSTGIHSMYAKRRKKKSRKEAIRITNQVKSDEVLNECDRSKATPPAVPIATTQYCGSSAMHMMGFGWLLGACFGDTYSVCYKSGDDGLEYKTCNTPKTAEMSSSDDDYDRESDHEDDDDDDDESSGGSTHPSASRVNQVLHLPAINMKEDNISDISSSSSEDSSWSSDYSDSDDSKSIQGVSGHQMKEGRRLHLILKRQR